MLQFTSKSLFVVTAWVAVVLMGMRILADELPMSRLQFVNAAVAMAGTMLGTIAGTLSASASKPEGKYRPLDAFDRWLLSFVIGSIFGATHIVWFIGPGYVLLFLSLIWALIHAFVAATLTELLRLVLAAVES